MAVPHVAPHISFEPHDNAGHHAGVRSHRVFPAGFSSTGWNRVCRVAQPFRVEIAEQVEWPAIQYLKTHQMEMDWMGIVRQIDQTPDLNRVENRLLGHWIMP